MDELDSGTAAEPVSQGLPSAEPAGEALSSATPAVETPAAPPEESFIDPSQLPDDIKPHWKRMHGAYTKTREELKQGREAYAQVQRFYQDAAYQEQLLRQVATQRGWRVVGPNEQAPAAATAQQNGTLSAQAPPHLVDTIKQRLAPELQWMAQSLAESQWAAVQEATRPLLQKQETDTRNKIQQDIEEASAELGTKFPGWEAEEDSMNDVFEWLSSGSMRHPQYGNRMEALYKFTQMLKGHNGHAVQEAGKRMAEAARNRTVSSQATRPSTENWSEQIRTAKTSRDAFAIAQKAAEEELRRQGVSIPN